MSLPVNLSGFKVGHFSYWEPPYFEDTLISLQHSIGQAEGSLCAINQLDLCSRFDRTDLWQVSILYE